MSKEIKLAVDKYQDVWFMHNNKPINGNIVKIKADIVMNSSVKLVYSISTVNYEIQTRPEEYVFGTKAELVNSL